jgi:hypothetical protein
VAPTALTVFKGSEEEPVALCSIDLGKSGTAMRKLEDWNKQLVGFRDCTFFGVRELKRSFQW